MTKEDFERLAQMIPGLVIKMTKMIGFRRWKIENKLLDLHMTENHVSPGICKISGKEVKEDENNKNSYTVFAGCWPDRINVIRGR
jgi:dolichyl-phosphate-mannose--protein O-mannosyl transferase